MNQAQGLRRKNRIQATALALFVGSSAMGVGYTMTKAGALNFGLAEFCVAVQAAIVSWIFYAAMSFMFLKKPGYELQEGTYSDISWINADENKLVLLERDSIASVAFDSAQRNLVVDCFTADSSCNTILENSKDFQINRIQWADVTAVISRSNDASVDIETNYGITSLPFLNVDTKEHALRYIRAKLPATALVVQNEQSNAMTVMLLFVGLLTFVTGALLVGSMAITSVVGGIASLFFPAFLKALYEPDIETVIRVSNSYGHDYESNIPPSTSSVVPVTKSFSIRNTMP